MKFGQSRCLGLNRIGETFVKTWFAYLPVKVGSEIRWLEKVSVRYQAVMGLDKYKTVSFQAQEFLNQPIDNSIGYQSKYKGPMATRR
jgi:hypothetical protein